MKTGRDDYDELLSAYVDGEVSSAERERIVQRLAGNAEYRGELAALRELHAALRGLPRYRLAAEIHQRIMREIQRTAPPATDMPPVLSLDPELLSAYFDGEVSASERQLVERALGEDDACRRQFEELQYLDAVLQQLPRHTLGEGFVERVQQRIAVETAAVPPAEPVRPQPAGRRTSRGAGRNRSNWTSLIWTSLGVVAVLLAIVHFRPAPQPGPTLVDADGRGGRDVGQAPPVGLSPLTLVDRRLRDRLLLVYEVAVTPEGVHQGVFFRLLKQQGIHVLDTVPVPERDQRALLACRFLQGVQSVGIDAAGDLDRVQMYMVYCAAHQAEAMFRELASRPEGFASFSMNLTTRQIGDGVLPRLAGEFGERRLGDAIQLAANFGILSSVGRQLGSFGTVGYIDPELLTPPASPGESALRQAEEDAAAQQAAGVPPHLADDFPCEVLFVVRCLRPLPQDSQPRTLSRAK